MTNAKFLYSQLKICAEVWSQIKDVSIPADRWLGNYFHRYRKRFGSRERRFISETIYSAFRHKTYLEAWARKLSVFENPELLVAMAAALEGIVPLQVLGEEFQHSKIKFPPRFFPSFEGRTTQELGPFGSQEEEWAIRYSFPLWIVRRWIEQYGKTECGAILKASQERPPLVIRANSLKISRERLLSRLHKRGFQCAPTERSSAGILFQQRVNVFDTEEFRAGFFEVQDEGSQIICERVAPAAGEVVWDVCAGGGGKSLFLAALMENKGRIIATDIRARKLAELRKRMRRAGASNIYPAELERIEKVREMRQGADKILIDAPCSGTGTFRRNPDAKWKLTPDRLEVYQKEQLAILENVLPHLKPGGRLYYVTCSLDALENEEAVKRILARHSELRHVPYPDSSDGFVRLFPHRHRTDGFFLAIAENKR